MKPSLALECYFFKLYILVLFKGNCNVNHAKLDRGLDQSSTGMVREKKQRKNRNRAYQIPVWLWQRPILLWHKKYSRWIIHTMNSDCVFFQHILQRVQNYKASINNNSVLNKSIIINVLRVSTWCCNNYLIIVLVDLIMRYKFKARIPKDRWKESSVLVLF